MVCAAEKMLSTLLMSAWVCTASGTRPVCALVQDGWMEARQHQQPHIHAMLLGSMSGWGEQARGQAPTCSVHRWRRSGQWHPWRVVGSGGKGVAGGGKRGKGGGGVGEV